LPTGEAFTLSGVKGFAFVLSVANLKWYLAEVQIQS
jgi:hypothetical protein